MREIVGKVAQGIKDTVLPYIERVEVQSGLSIEISAGKPKRFMDDVDWLDLMVRRRKAKEIRERALVQMPKESPRH